MARLKDSTELNENIIASLGEDSLNTGNESNNPESTNENPEDKGLENITVVVKEATDNIPDHAHKILKMYSNEEKLFVGLLGEVYTSSCNIKEVVEKSTLYNNPYYKK